MGYPPSRIHTYDTNDIAKFCLHVAQSLFATAEVESAKYPKVEFSRFLQETVSMAIKMPPWVLTL